MISALVYLQSRTVLNRLRLQLGRLRRPKYLLGALLGGAYLWFFFLRPFLLPTGEAHAILRGGGPRVGEGGSLLEIGAAFGLFLLVLSGWLFPKRRAALDFTEAEIAFLFPAPLTRRTLIHFKLLRSQLRMLVSAAFMSLLSSRLASPGQVAMQVAGWWLMMCTIELHLLGVSFTRTRWLDRGVGHVRRRLLVLGALGVPAVAVGIWAWRALPAVPPGSAMELQGLAELARQTATSGPIPWLLLPFRLLLRPLFARELATFAAALVPALGLFAAHYLWVIRSEVSFEEASLERAREKARTLAAVRSGNWHLARGQRRPIRAPFSLRPSGPPLVALVWKNLIAASATLSLRFWGGAGLVVLLAALVLRIVHPEAVLLKVAGGAAMGLMPALTFWGAAVLVFDLRQDLANADLLKTYPLPGWKLALGELLTPVALLTAVQWFLLLLAGLTFSTSVSGLRVLGPADVLGWGLGLAVVAPGLNANSFVLMNAGVLLFPGWMQAGPGRAEGFEAMGHRMLFMVAQLLALLLLLLLPAAVFAGLVFVGRLALPMAACVPLAGGAAALVLAAEAAAGLLLLGHLFERLDLSDERIGS